ncbi:MAG TPA: hypothetical protein VK762_16865 [Polyangiaceae bacterium]|nr:hypothetical protein [Polyangiaceae bacterium]
MRIRQVVGVGAGVGLVAALAVGCMAKKSAPYPDVTSFCDAKAEAECQIAMTCVIDPDQCKVTRVADCNSDAMTATTNGTGTRKYTQANAQACIDALNSAYGGGNTTVSFAALQGKGSIADLCGRVFSGNSSMNQPCQSAYDCTGDLICAPVMPGSTSLVCASSMTVKEGDFCASPGSTCATDSYCGLPSASAAYQCEAAKLDGQSCDPVTAPCVSAERCVSAGTGQVCEARVQAGQSCQSDDDCAPAAPYCDPYANKCTAGQSFALGAADCAEFEPGGATTGTSASDSGSAASDAGSD